MAVPHTVGFSWQELEAEEEPVPRALRLWVPGGPKTGWAPPRGPTTPGRGCLRYFVLGTVAALVALVLNVFYPLVSQSPWR